MDSLQVTLDTFTKNLESESVERDTFLRKVQDIRIELLNLENKRENFLNQKKSIVGIVSELEVRNKEIKSELYSSKSKDLDLDRNQKLGGFFHSNRAMDGLARFLALLPLPQRDFWRNLQTFFDTIQMGESGFTLTSKTGPF